jgi:Holliday junction resolvase RusA-like endonuclease
MVQFRHRDGMSLEPAISITVHGMPAPQGSKRPFRNKYTGRIHNVESSTRVAPWRQDVKHAALTATELIEIETETWSLLTGPLVVAMTFSFPRPKGHWRTGRHSDQLRPSAPARPAGRPDLSKLARSTEDALTDVVWCDDAQVVEYLRLAKYYTGHNELDVMPVGAGCVIRVWRLGQAPGALRRFDTVTECRLDEEGA